MGFQKQKFCKNSRKQVETNVSPMWSVKINESYDPSKISQFPLEYDIDVFLILKLQFYYSRELSKDVSITLLLSISERTSNSVMKNCWCPTISKKLTELARLVQKIIFQDVFILIVLIVSLCWHDFRRSRNTKNRW